MSDKLTVEDFVPCKTCGHQKRKHHAKGTDPVQCWHKGCGGCTEFVPAVEPYIDVLTCSTGAGGELAPAVFLNSDFLWQHMTEFPSAERDGARYRRIHPSDIYYAAYRAGRET